jgi:hypothetical protein
MTWHKTACILCESDCGVGMRLGDDGRHSGRSHPDGDRSWTATGVAPNSLTSTDHCDELAGTPLHKHVPARLEPVAVPAPVPVDVAAG